jgi:hypothetical protein
MCALSGVLAIALPVPVIVSNFEYYYKEELARQIAEQSREQRKAREEEARTNHLSVQMPPPLSSSISNIDQEILELKGVKRAHSRQDVGNHYTKLSPKTTPNTPRKKVETVL